MEIRPSSGMKKSTTTRRTKDTDQYEDGACNGTSLDDGGNVREESRLSIEWHSLDVV